MKTANVLPLWVACLAPIAVAAPPAPPVGYKWVANEKFTDEYNGTSLDTDKWFDHHPQWKGRPPAKFVPGAVSVADGCLRLRNGVLPKPEGDYTLSGGAVTSRSQNAFYGYYEARMKASKISMSSTFWLSNDAELEGDARVSQELDIVETIGAPHAAPKWARDWNKCMNSNTHIFRRIDNKKEDIAGPGKTPVDPPVGEAFHTYAAWWVDANTVRYYLDDEYKFTLHPDTRHSPTPFHRPMRINLVTETYDWQAPPSTADITNNAINTTYYDWVRAWTLVKVNPTNTAPATRPAAKKLTSD